MAQDQPLLIKELDPARYGNGRRQSLILPRLLTKAADDLRLRDQAQVDAHRVLLKWADLDAAGRLRGMSETALEGEFVGEIFGDALHYARFSENLPAWQVQQKLAVPGGIADAALGHFAAGGPHAPAALVELKGPTVDVDRDRSRGRTPVQQCWDYLYAVPECPWGIVCNYVSFRLYHRNRTPLAYESFTLQELRDEATFRRFYALFERRGLLATMGEPGRAAQLLALTEARQEEVGDELYDDYSKTRLALLGHLRDTLGTAPGRALAAVQKLLDRVIFVAFCEDRELLPAGAIKSAIESVPPFQRVTNPRWRNFRDLFRSIDEGNPAAHINRFNGGLFAADPDVDDLDLDDRWTAFFGRLSGYDFKDEVSVDVLGKLFERSITEIEQLHAAPAGRSSMCCRRTRLCVK